MLFKCPTNSASLRLHRDFVTRDTAIFNDPGFAFRLSISNKCDQAERMLVAENYHWEFGRTCLSGCRSMAD